MKKIDIVIGMCLILGCSGSPEIIEPIITYIDYSCYPQEQLSQNDLILLENIEFQEGKLSCLLDLESALEQGIPEKKYNYFLEYLQNENLKIEEYLESGVIVFYNGKPFTRNEELYQYIDTEEQSLSRVTYSQTIPLYSRTFKYNSVFPKDWVSFKGPSKIQASFTGYGSFYLQEKSKKIEAYLSGSQTSAAFKWGFHDNVFWEWDITYKAFSPTAYANFNFWGNVEDPMPDFPTNETINQKIWYNNLPTYVKIEHNRLDDYISIVIEEIGTYSYFAQIFKKSGDNYDLYATSPKFSNYTISNIKTPSKCTFGVVIYRVKVVDGNVSYSYLGDSEYRYPLHWGGWE
jgi:lipoprotein